MKIKAIIFDMDGVLIEAKDWHYEALNRALNLFGYNISRYDHLVTYDGLPTRIKLEMLSLERGLPRALHQFINDMKQQYTLEIVYQKCKPTFYHEYALSKLKAEGYRLAVASNSVRNSVVMMMEKSNLLPYLEFMLSNQDVQKPKPDPEIYQVAISKLGLEPEECLIVEDNPNGIKAAKDSGAHVYEVETVKDVNYQAITSVIDRLTGGGCVIYEHSNPHGRRRQSLQRRRLSLQQKLCGNKSQTAFSARVRLGEEYRRRKFYIRCRERRRTQISYQ